jgi:transposase
MSEKRYVVTLAPEEREYLTGLLRKGMTAALVLTRARILLKADQAGGGPAWDDARIAEALGVGERTVSRVRRRFVERGFEASLRRKPQDQPSRERVLDGAAEARLVALACSKAPGGRAEWTMQLLADKLVELDVVPSVSDETVRRVLKKTRSSRGGRSSGASPGSRRASSWPGWRT